MTKKETYIWGAGHFGVLTALDLEQKGIQIKGFIDKNASKIKTRLGLPVLTFEQVPKNETKIIIAVQNKCAIREITQILSLAGLNQDKDFEISTLIAMPKEPFEFYRLKMFEPPMIKHLSVGLAEHCNLNCAYCDHYCPVAEHEFPSTKQFDLDFAVLSKLTNGTIGRINLVGGEPLLNPDITDIMQIVRKNIPNSEITITTNGILLAKMAEDFWNACKNNNISIVISQYPIKLDTNKICQTAIKYEVNVFWGILVGGNLFRMQKYNVNGTQDIYKSYKNCGTKGCTFLKNGKIYLCPQISCSKNLEKAFNVNFSVSSNDFLVLDNINSVQDILDFISKPSPFCRYCSTEDKCFVQWKVSERKREEWIL